MSYIYNLTDTWNSAGTTFAGIKMAVTNTASGASSKLLDLSVSGATTGSFSVDRSGNASISGALTLGTALSPANGGSGTSTVFTAGSLVFAGASGVYSQNNANLFWDSANARLGVGTAAPPTLLSVGGFAAPSSSNFFHVFCNIGGVNPPAANPFGVWIGRNKSGGGNEGNLIYSNLLTFGSWDGTTYAERVRINASGNVGIGTSTFGTSAATVLSIATGTAPTTGPADTIQIYSTDLSAGNTILSLFTEGTPVNANTTAAATHRIAIRINGTVYYLLANTSA